MKYIIKILFILIIIINILPNYTKATNLEVLTSQQEELNIKSFIKQTEKYTKNVLTDTDMGDIFNSALTGKIDNNKMFNKVLNIFGKETKETITILR